MYLLTKAIKYKTVLTLAVVMLFGLALAPAVLAQETNWEVFGVNDFNDEIALGQSDLNTTIARIINVALSLLGIVAVVIILIGGFKYMTAGGNDEKVATAKKWIFSGLIGLIIILSAYALASWVIAQLINATT